VASAHSDCSCAVSMLTVASTASSAPGNLTCASLVLSSSAVPGRASLSRGKTTSLTFLGGGGGGSGGGGAGRYTIGAGAGLGCAQPMAATSRTRDATRRRGLNSWTIA